MSWKSQAGQDEWVLKMFSYYPTTGFFVDLGAYDGVEHSNTWTLEQEYGWHGICVEANPDYFKALTKNRPTAHNINAAVTASEGQVHFLGQNITASTEAPIVRCAPLQTLLAEAKAPYTIDYLSVDIEGLEFDVLEAFNFAAYMVKLITVEHNLYCEGPANKDRLFDLLTHRGFTRVVEDAPCLDTAYFGLPYEDWYCNQAFFSL